jgi:hypothetical protein
MDMVSITQKILGVLLGAALIFVAVAPATFASEDDFLNITVGEWKFILCASGWMLGNDHYVDTPGDRHDPGHAIEDDYTPVVWDRVLKCDRPFYYPACPGYNPAEPSATVNSITVLSIPTRTGMSTYSILTAAMELVSSDKGECDIGFDPFKHHDAMTRTWTDDKTTRTVLAVRLTDRRAAVIDVTVNRWDDRGCGHSATAKDVINSFIIERAA